ncbi:PREDICTED: negative elongation factor A isoform X2 [Atta colombica]|uniref:negative elongation factor A isoform X2 n=1 Tax=Atta colombica TaxID=520822 RepID=UPI00084C277F|nr:PREDICTED: negative elongation factor A isoform X2 [Atta colombica]
MLSEAMKTFPSTGSLNTDITDLDEHRPIFVVGQQPTPVKHFTLKRKPKSAALRAELLQKSTDAASNLKKSTAPTVPVRSRGMPRKMTDTTPLKGIPSRVPTSGFRSPSLTNTSMSNRTSISRIRKDGGIKLLDITEQPMGFVAKKRKKMMDFEEQQKKAVEAQATIVAEKNSAAPSVVETTTPEYAQGLASINPPATPVTPTVVVTTQSYTAPSTPSSISVTTTQQTPTTLTTTTTTTPTAVLAVTTPTVITPVESTPVAVQTVRPAQTVTQIRIQTTTTNAAANPRKGLSLTREQMLEAQEMFRTANKVTRPEKALILGFMAGSRDNPCPKLGNIVTVMLSENVEEVTQSDGTIVPMLVETHFQMNYTNGEWKRIKKNRRIVTEESTSTSTPTPNATATASN